MGGNTTVNIKTESQQLLRKLAFRNSTSMRAIVEIAVEQYALTTLPTDEMIEMLGERITERLEPIFQTLIKEALANALQETVQKIRKDQEYKPWLQNADGESDDIQVLPL
jgi:hypothetical protein